MFLSLNFLFFRRFLQQQLEKNEAGLGLGLVLALSGQSHSHSHYSTIHAAQYMRRHMIRPQSFVHSLTQQIIVGISNIAQLGGHFHFLSMSVFLRFLTTLENNSFEYDCLE